MGFGVFFSPDWLLNKQATNEQSALQTCANWSLGNYISLFLSCGSFWKVLAQFGAAMVKFLWEMTYFYYYLKQAGLLIVDLSGQPTLCIAEVYKCVSALFDFKGLAGLKSHFAVC